MANTNDCCDDNTPATGNYNPAKERSRKRHSGRLKLFDIKNPIEGEVADSEGLKKFFKDYNFVPYAGASTESGHALLAWYIALSKLSPTHGTCISKLGKYAFGGKAIFVRSEDPDYQLTDYQPPQISAQEGQLFYEALKKYVTFPKGIRDFHRSVSWSYKVTGNSFVELVVANTSGEIHCTVNYHKPMNCLYDNTPAKAAKVVYVSPIWTEEYLRKNNARGVPIYPNFTKDKDGNLRTMFHLKHGDNTWYGRPDTDFADMAKANEAQQSLYLIKAANSNFMGQLILEVEDGGPDQGDLTDDTDSQNAGFSSFIDEFEQNYTMKSDDPQSVIIMSRPYGASPMSTFQMSPNTNENWFVKIGEKDEGVIMRAHSCTRRFLGFEVKSGLSGSDSFLTDYIVNMDPVITEFRNDVCNFTNKILTAVWDIVGMPQLNAISVSFTSPIQSVVDEFKVSGMGKDAKIEPVSTDKNDENDNNDI